MNKTPEIPASAPAADSAFRAGDEVEIRFRLLERSNSADAWKCAVVGAEDFNMPTAMFDFELRLGRRVKRGLAVGDSVRDSDGDDAKVLFIVDSQAVIEYTSADLRPLRSFVAVDSLVRL